MFGTEIKTKEQVVKPTEEKKAAAKTKEQAVIATGKSEEEKKEARRASAKKMMENKKKNLQVLINFAKKHNTGDKEDKTVTEAIKYLSGEARHSASRITLVEDMFPSVGVTLKSVDIFIKWEKGRSEMISLLKKAETKNIIIDYNEEKKVYTRIQ